MCNIGAVLERIVNEPWDEQDARWSISGGGCSRFDAKDQSRLSKFESITKQMPARVKMGSWTLTAELSDRRRLAGERRAGEQQQRTRGGMGAYSVLW